MIGERMDGSPEERLRARATAAGGRVRLSAAELLEEFGAHGSTPLAHVNIEQALRGAGLHVEPSLQVCGLDTDVTLCLSGEEAREHGSRAPAQTEPEEARQRTERPDGSTQQPAEAGPLRHDDEGRSPRPWFPRPGTRPQTAVALSQRVKR